VVSKRPDDFGFRYNTVLWSLLQHPSLGPHGRRAVGPRFVSFAAVFYGFLAVVAAVWCGLRGIELPVFGPNPLAGLTLGLATAAGTVSLSLLAYRLVPITRKLAEELAPSLVDRADRTGLVLVALFSGVGEEVFFRGAVQQEFGIVISSLAFGLAHVGPDRRYLLWTAWAVLAGFVFGLLFEATGGLLAPVTAHALHNAATLLIWKRTRPDVSADE
jgi:membrane protease YdiL (CAAX protease family)